MLGNVIYKWKLTVYEVLVNRNRYVKKEYQHYVAHRKKKIFLCSLAEITILNIKHVIFKQKYHRIPVTKYPETGQTTMPPPEVLVTKLSEADVISFDIFDTLLFRPFSDPKTLFYLLGIKFGIANFCELRKNAEMEAQENAEKESREANITDIYEVLNKWCNISAENGVWEEVSLEKELCFANPYMKKVFEQVKKQGKKIFLLSDMYLRKETLEGILSKNGIEGYDEILISNECQCSKANGSLYLYAERQFNAGKSFYHIGDNLHSDIEMARKQGWKCYYYKNVNQIGKYFRPEGMSPLFGSIYDGLVNTWLYGQEKKRSLYYEYGFCCGGVLAVAYCQWLERLATQNHIDRFWFVARDGDILYRLYKKYWGNISCDYIAFSRAASEQVVAEDYMQEYITNAVWSETKVAASKAMTTRQLFHSLGIAEMCNLLPYGDLTEDSICTEDIYPLLRQFLYTHKETFDACFSDARHGAKKYFKEKSAGARKICVVDIGWRGSSINYVKHLFEKKYHWDIEVCGALLCSGEDSHPDANELFQVIQIFCASKGKEADWVPLLRKYWKCVEMLFSSEAPTLLAYGLKKEKVEFLYADQNENANVIHEIQSGIKDFAEWYFTHMHRYAHAMQISGRDAIMPLIYIIQNRKLAERLEMGFMERESDRHVRSYKSIPR